MKRRGITVIEVLVVVLIVVMLLGLLFPAMQAARQLQKEVATESPVTEFGKELAFEAKVNGMLIKAYHFEDKQGHEFHLFRKYSRSGWLTEAMSIVHRPDCKMCK